jgi:Carbonic anhydrase
MSHGAVNFDLDTLLKSLDSGLAEFEKSFPLDDFSRGNYQQHPFVTLLTCCDSRVSPSMLGDTFNRIFCVENIGNQLKNAEGSVLYGLLHLHTPLMIVAGHSECGAIKAATSDFSGEAPALADELTMVKGSLEKGCSGITINLAAGSLSQAQLSELNVDVQIDMLLAHPDIVSLVEKKALQIIGVFVDLHNIFQEGCGKVFTINVNGEKDTEAIKQLETIGGFAARARRLPR